MTLMFCMFSVPSMPHALSNVPAIPLREKAMPLSLIMMTLCASSFGSESSTMIFEPS